MKHEYTVQCAECSKVLKEQDCVWYKKIQKNKHIWFIPYCKECYN